jgi:hypothetical protein
VILGRAFTYVILGGGGAAGYLGFIHRRGVATAGDLCIISEEAVSFVPPSPNHTLPSAVRSRMLSSAERQSLLRSLE